MKNLLLAGVILLGLASPSLAQPYQLVPTCGAQTLTGQLNNFVLGYIDATGNLCTNASGGGGGGAVTIADGADVTQGALADAAATAGGTGSVSAKLRLMTTQLNAAATAANQSTEISSLATIATNTGSAIPAGTAIIGKVGIDQTTPNTTNAVSLAQIGGTTIVNGGVAGSQGVGGTVATNVAITDNPLNNGAQAVSSENAAVTTARKVQLVADLVGKLIVLPYANPENFVSGVITSAMTGTTSTSLIAAPAAGLRNYITQCTFSNSHATVGTDIILQDGSGGTTIYLAPTAPAFGGATISFPTPLRQPTTATALFVANVTTGSNTKVACSGYKGA